VARRGAPAVDDVRGEGDAVLHRAERDPSLPGQVTHHGASGHRLVRPVAAGLQQRGAGVLDVHAQGAEAGLDPDDRPGEHRDQPVGAGVAQLQQHGVPDDRAETDRVPEHDTSVRRGRVEIARRRDRDHGAGARLRGGVDDLPGDGEPVGGSQQAGRRHR
jgi:hypothetical protein